MSAVNLTTYLTLKALKRDDGERWISATATTPTPDRVGDIVEPAGARYELPMPLLFAHRHAEPVGVVKEARVDAAGITIRAKVVEGTQRADEVWTLIEAGALAAVSVGFRATKTEPLPSGGLRFTEWDWHETSVVAVPANPEARLSVGKFYATRAESSPEPTHARAAGRFDPEAAADRVADGVKAYVDLHAFAPLDARLRALEAGGRVVRGLDPDAFGEEIGEMIRAVILKERGALAERLGGMQQKLDGVAERGLRFDGDWTAAQRYEPGSVVRHAGRLYTALKAVAAGGHPPTPRAGGAWANLTGE